MAAMVTCGLAAPSGTIPMHCRRLSQLRPHPRGGVERGVRASISTAVPPSLASKQADAAGTATAPPAVAGGDGGNPAASGGSRRRLTFEQRYRQLELFSQQHGNTLVPVREESGEGLAALGAEACLPFCFCSQQGTTPSQPNSQTPLIPPPPQSIMHPCAATCGPLAGLGMWVARQRHAWKAGRLPPARQQQLAALGFCCDAFQESWAAHFGQLAAFHSEHGHCRVQRSAWAQQRHPGLYTWLQQQAHQWRQGTLPDDRRRRLEGMGVVFRAAQTTWDQRFEELLLFQQVRPGLGWGAIDACGCLARCRLPQYVLLCGCSGGRGQWAGQWRGHAHAHAPQQPLVAATPADFHAACVPPLPAACAPAAACCRSLGTRMCPSSGLATPAWPAGWWCSGGGGAASRAPRCPPRSKAACSAAGEWLWRSRQRGAGADLWSRFHNGFGNAAYSSCFPSCSRHLAPPAPPPAPAAASGSTP